MLVLVGEVVALAQFLHRMGPVRVPVGVVRRIQQAAVADVADGVGQGEFPALHAEVAPAAAHVFAGRARAERRLHVASLLPLLVQPVHPVRHPTGAGLQEPNPQPGIALQHAAEDELGHGDHLLERMGHRMDGQELVEPVRARGVPRLAVDGDGHVQPLHRLVERVQLPVRQLAPSHVGRRLHRHHAQLHQPPELLHRALDFLQRHDAHALDAVGVGAAELVEPPVVGAGQHPGPGRVAHVADAQARGGEEHRGVDALGVHVRQLPLGVRHPVPHAPQVPVPAVLGEQLAGGVVRRRYPFPVGRHGLGQVSVRVDDRVADHGGSLPGSRGPTARRNGAGCGPRSSRAWLR